jgi:hypothetical protein
MTGFQQTAGSASALIRQLPTFRPIQVRQPQVLARGDQASRLAPDEIKTAATTIEYVPST